MELVRKDFDGVHVNARQEVVMEYENELKTLRKMVITLKSKYLEAFDRLQPLA